jgi:hypothetical protein
VKLPHLYLASRLRSYISTLPYVFVA